MRAPASFHLDMADTRHTDSGRSGWQLPFAIGIVCTVALVSLPYPVRHYGLLGAIAVGAAGAVLASFMLHPLFLFSLYFACLFFAETPVPGLPVTANQVFAILFFVSVLARWARGRTNALRSGFLPILCFVAAFFAISAITGESWQRGFTHFRYVIVYFVMALALAAVLRSERAVYVFAGIVVVLTFAAAVSGLVEAFQKSALTSFSGNWTRAVRIRGTAKNSIVYAWNLIYAFPFAFFLFSQLRSNQARFGALLMGFFILLVAILTFNRQTYVFLLVQIGLVSWLFAYRNRRFFLAFVSVAGCLALIVMLPMVMARLSTVTALGMDASYQERRDSLLLALEMFRRHPVFGIGLGSFPAVWQHYIPADYSTFFAQYQGTGHLRFPDFGYVQLLCETGLVGLFLFLVQVIYLVRWSWTARRKARERDDMFALNFSAMVLTQAAMLALTSSIQDTFLYVRVWFVYGLALMLDDRFLVRRTEGPPAAEHEAT